VSDINLKSPQSVRIQGYLEGVDEASAARIADVLDIPHATVTATVYELYRCGMIYVSNWDRTAHGAPFKVYKWGDGDDAPLPPKRVKPPPPAEVVLPFPRCDVAASWLTAINKKATVRENT